MRVKEQMFRQLQHVQAAAACIQTGTWPNLDEHEAPGHEMVLVEAALPAAIKRLEEAVQGARTDAGVGGEVGPRAEHPRNKAEAY